MRFSTKLTAFPAVVGLSVLAGCAVNHSIPRSTVQPNRVIAAEQRAEAFVDQNGTFYPRDWHATYGPPPSKGAYSLITMARRNGTLDALLGQQRRQVDEFASFLADKQRVFVFIHGFNNDQEDAKASYDLIREAIALQQSDGIVEFYWDGLVGDGLGAAPIWFNATGYSQLAGSKGLRSILNRVHNKDVFIIAHSRGASVTLSALSDPPYNPTFAADTERFHGVKVYDHDRLSENGNRIKVIFLAPAIGALDFHTTDRAGFREFSGQLKQIQHTVNVHDPVLRKFVGAAAASNPTDFGTDVQVSRSVSAHYPFISYKDFSGMKSHKFYHYVGNPLFKEMLTGAGIQTR